MLLVGLAVGVVPAIWTTGVDARVRDSVQMGDPTVGDEKPAQGPHKTSPLRGSAVGGSDNQSLQVSSVHTLRFWNQILESRGLIVAFLWIP